MKTIGQSRIAGIGAYLPEQVVTSDELMEAVNCRRFGIPETYLSRYVGIHERRWADPEMQPSEMASLASEVALRNSGVTPDEVDLIIFTGITRDCEEPSTAHFVQQRLGANNAFCLDVSNACLGFMTGLSVADAYIASGAARTVLVCTGEAPSHAVRQCIKQMLEQEDKKLFKSWLGFLTAGDAGGAMVVRPAESDEEGLRWIRFASKGKHAKLCYYRRLGEELDGQMVMSEISKEMIQFNQELIETTFDQLDWSPESIDKLYCHQVGAKPHIMLAELAKQTPEKAPVTYDRFGNLTSATMPVNMYLNPPERGDRLLFFGAGSGLSICHGGMVF